MGFLKKITRLFTVPQAEGPAALPGRNEDCWCGSGRKYKKCHLAEDEKKRSQKSCSLNCGPA